MKRLTHRVLITRDHVEDVMHAVDDLLDKRVLIGIPESNASRADGPMNNATLGYIHEFGSPAANIPARPFLIPGVQKAFNAAIVKVREAAQAALDGRPAQVDKSLAAAGLIAESSVKNEISTGNFVPLKPATVRARYRGRRTASRRAAEDQYLAMVKAGVSPAEAQDAAGIRPLIDTGALRNAITSVVARRKR